MDTCHERKKNSFLHGCVRIPPDFVTVFALQKNESLKTRDFFYANHFQPIRQLYGQRIVIQVLETKKKKEKHTIVPSPMNEQWAAPAGHRASLWRNEKRIASGAAVL
jgi:hypothetical protein